ncbi:hypothetical protein [Paraburkholderia oxyphila]|uniref:hypothetical protein n=1 Tax=Paraburkholderia oxyphila TaxID=614212 RepID=UPI0012EE7F25|nr:hypothetical protein [Paraburkholderia oxyphila]
MNTVTAPQQYRRNKKQSGRREPDEYRPATKKPENGQGQPRPDRQGNPESDHYGTDYAAHIGSARERKRGGQQRRQRHL